MGMHIQKGRSRALRSLMAAALEKGAPWASCHVFRWLKCYGQEKNEAPGTGCNSRLKEFLY